MSPMKDHPGRKPGTLAERAYSLRKKVNLTQEALAAELGISRSHVGHMETRGDIPSVSTLVAYLDYFHVSADYLLGRTDVDTIRRDTKGYGELIHDADELLLLRIWRWIPVVLRTGLLSTALEIAQLGGFSKGSKIDDLGTGPNRG